MFNMFINNLRRYIHFVVGTFVILVLMYLLNERKNYNRLKLAIENGSIMYPNHRSDVLQS